MTESAKPVSPLRQSVIDDMVRRKLAPETARNYQRTVERFARYFRRSPDRADAEYPRRFQLHLATDGVSRTNTNQILTGLRFFDAITLSRPEILTKVSHVREPETLPLILGMEEVTRRPGAAANLREGSDLFARPCE